MEIMPAFRPRGVDLVVGEYRIDIKTPSLRVPPKRYHSFLIEKSLVEKGVTNLFVCQYSVRPEMQMLYLVGYATAEDVIAFGKEKKIGENLYGCVSARYDGYLVASEHLNDPEGLKALFAGKPIGDPLMTR